LYLGERETLLPVGNDEDAKCPRKLSAARLERKMRIDNLRTTATACAALLLAAAAWSDSAAPADLAQFEGEWTRSAREQNDTDRAAVIDRSMEHMPFWARGFASALMRASISPPERYTILVTPTGLSISDDDDEPVPALFGTNPDAADDVRVMARISDETLQQHWRNGEHSYGTTLWTVTEARELVVSVEAYDTRLRDADGGLRAIRYATIYSLDPEATSARRSE
jgi:hypothetical protein